MVNVLMTKPKGIVSIRKTVLIEAKEGKMAILVLEIEGIMPMEIAKEEDG